MTRALKSFKLLCFDCYGTIVDWETPIYAGLSPILSRSSRTSEWSKEDALVAFGNVEKDLQVQFPDMIYSKILEESYKAFGKRLEVEVDEVDAKAFGESIKTWEPYPDSISALIRLSKHYHIVILSNVDRPSFTSTLALLSPFVPSLVLTAQEIGTYKPSQNNFNFMLNAVKDKFGVEKEEVLITAVSLYHDHQPANALGMKSCWIAREGAVMGVGSDLETAVRYDWKFTTLEEMADAVENEKNKEQ